MKIAYKKSLYKHHALLNYYKSNMFIFGYLSNKIHMCVVHSNFFMWISRISHGAPGCFLLVQFNKVHKLDVLL